MKTVYLLVTLICSILLSSCALLEERSFEGVMRKDDTPFFDANRDFSVAYGDSGEVGRTRQEIFDRTPDSSRLKKEYVKAQSIKSELFRLEQSQTAFMYQNYLKHRDYFSNDSERIYYLNLQTFEERENFLRSKGFRSDRQQFTRKERRMASFSNEVIYGMNKNAVLSIMGKPVRIDIAGHPSLENERWAYEVRGGVTKFIYFERGQVEGWTEDRQYTQASESFFGYE